MASPDAMSHSQLLRLRNRLPDDSPRQSRLAALEHAAFAREWTREQPVRAVASLLFAIPGYYAGKKLGVIDARSPASLASVAAAYDGMWQGLGQAMGRQ